MYPVFSSLFSPLSYLWSSRSRRLVYCNRDAFKSNPFRRRPCYILSSGGTLYLQVGMSVLVHHGISLSLTITLRHFGRQALATRHRHWALIFGRNRHVKTCCPKLEGRRREQHQGRKRSAPMTRSVRHTATRSRRQLLHSGVTASIQEQKSLHLEACIFHNCGASEVQSPWLGKAFYLVSACGLLSSLYLN